MVKLYSPIDKIKCPICQTQIDILPEQHDLAQHFSSAHKGISKLPFIQEKLRKLKPDVDTPLGNLPSEELDLLLENLCMDEANRNILKAYKQNR